MTPNKIYDYAIIGAGAAGLQLVLKMSQDSFFQDKRIAIFEKEEKNINDRTWCFWEVGESGWDYLTTKIWKKGIFISNKRLAFSLEPYSYKMIRSADFYAHAKAVIHRCRHIEWIKEEVQEIAQDRILVSEGFHRAHHIFDSRIDPSFYESGHPKLLQHFKGWFIETKKEVFDPTGFTMMDYRKKWKNQTSFTYILPLSPTRALVEFTLFNLDLLDDKEYDLMLEEYISEYLGVHQYKVLEVEKGIIPMSSYPFHVHHTKNLTKIGTGGGWVRASSGYSFRNADKYTSKMVENLKQGISPHKGLFNKRHAFYDALFLDVLINENELGEKIFSTCYQKNPVQRIFRFLDGKSSLIDDFYILKSLHHPAFYRALWAKFR